MKNIKIGDVVIISCKLYGKRGTKEEYLICSSDTHKGWDIIPMNAGKIVGSMIQFPAKISKINQENIEVISDISITKKPQSILIQDILSA